MFERLIDELPGARVEAVEEGATIFHQGAPTTAIFQVRSGLVSIVRHLADGGLLTVATAGPGETFAEAAIFANHYHCDAVARAPGEVLRLPTEALRQRLAREPELASALAEFYAAQVRDLRMRLELMRIKRAPDRLHAWLRWRARGNPPTIQPPDVWARVASEIGLSPEATYRALAKLERAGLIERQPEGGVTLLEIRA